MLSPDGISVRPTAFRVLIVPAEFAVEPCGTPVERIFHIHPLAAAFGFPASVDQDEMPDCQSGPGDACADRSARENLLLNFAERQWARHRGRSQPADDPQRFFQILRPIAGVGDVCPVRVGAAIRLTGLPAPRHPGRQFALTPGGVRIVMLAYARGDSRPTPFASQLTLQPDKQLGHVPETTLTSRANGVGHTATRAAGVGRNAAAGHSSFGYLLCRGFFRGALLGLLLLHGLIVLMVCLHWT